MLKYFAAFTTTVAVLLGSLYYITDQDLRIAKADLSAAQMVNKINQDSITRLERSIDTTDRVLAGWNEDRTTLAQIRITTQRTIKEAMTDEIFRNWGSTPVPTHAWQLLQSAGSGADGNGQLPTAVSAPPGVSGHTSSDVRR